MSLKIFYKMFSAISGRKRVSTKGLQFFCLEVGFDMLEQNPIKNNTFGFDYCYRGGDHPSKQKPI